VLPHLESGVVRNCWVSHDQFLAGYGAAQAVPGVEGRRDATHQI
jgi:chromate transporter